MERSKRSKLDILGQILLGIPGVVTLVVTIGCVVHFIVTTFQGFQRGNEYTIAAVASGVVGIFLIPFVIGLLIQGGAYVISFVLFLKRKAIAARVFGLISGFFGMVTVLGILMVIVLFFMEYPGIMGLVLGLTSYSFYLLVALVLFIISIWMEIKKVGKKG